MPKIIEDLDKKIIEAAEEVFLNNNYDDVEMKALAKKVGIAVGTLYNYFPNKLILFFKTFESFEKKQIEKYKKIQELDISPKDKLRKLFIEIYKGNKNYRNINFFAMYKNLDKKLFNDKKLKDHMKEISDESYIEIKKIFTNIISNVWTTKKLEDWYLDRLIPMVLMGMGHMNFNFENEEQRNIDFIINFIDEVIIKEENYEE